MSKFLLLQIKLYKWYWKLQEAVWGNLYGYYTPAFLHNEVERFKSFKKKLTPVLRREYQSATVDGVPVAEVGDLVWWPDPGKIVVLAGVKLTDGRFQILGFENGKFEVPTASGNSWLLNNLKEMPRLELDDDHVRVSITDELGLMVTYSRDYSIAGSSYTWGFSGTTWSGSAACRKFAEHGITLSMEQVS